MYEDQVFLAKICLKAPVFVESGCWDQYRQHSASSCSLAKKTGEYYSARPIFLNWLEKYCIEQNVKNAELWQALNKALWPYRHPILYRLSEQSQRLVNQGETLAKSVGRRVVPLTLRRWLKAQYSDELAK
jgi:hypothetical protein